MCSDFRSSVTQVRRMSKKAETGIVSYSSRDSWRRYMLGYY
ncbi:predicted protein [Botrytis cinerea T4]|uniref:Uncharacterized protein n=1 Tax=Botryotinia fuckeliana (strain T4) TaxID=999810 RepID=G2XYK7_BOTF4|nr:predicted protein [Botrytis cinerea T4]